MPLEGAKRCTVSFQHEGRVRLFATEVLNFLKAPNSPSGADAQLTLKTPESVRVRDSRLGVRVPVNPAVGLRVRVLRENNEFEEVGPRNISVSGLLVDSLGSQIQSEDQVKIELEHAGERIRIDCVVRRVHPDESIALVFVPVTKGSAAPDAIRQIVEKLEKDWMRRTRSLSAHMA
ncbi:MAG: PilZ domain-containing protein [Myxococcota bacterium]